MDYTEREMVAYKRGYIEGVNSMLDISKKILELQTEPTLKVIEEGKLGVLVTK